LDKSQRIVNAGIANFGFTSSITPSRCSIDDGRSDRLETMRIVLFSLDCTYTDQNAMLLTATDVAEIDRSEIFSR
jgi:hypothetical protein